MALNPGRLFTFGCSFTQYHWPTWADILGKHWSYYENWGQAGGGNQQIFYSLMECDQRRRLNSNDTVIIALTGVMRFDRYINGKWINAGCVSSDPFLARKQIWDNIVDERGFLIRDLAMIKSMFDLLDQRACEFRVFCMQSLLHVDYLDDKPVTGVHDVVKLYQDVLQRILPCMLTVLGEYATVEKDGHPLPREYLRYLDLVLPGWANDASVRDWINNYDVMHPQTGWQRLPIRL